MLNSVELSRHLRNGYGDEVTLLFLRHKISGNGFLEMTEADMCHLLPCIEDRVCIRKLLNRVSKMFSWG